MELNSDIILTSLVTSGFIVLLTKGLEVLQKRQEHSIELKKIFFEKKLAYAEKTVRYLNRKVEIFEKTALVLTQLEIVSTKKPNWVDPKAFEAWQLLNDTLLDDMSEKDIFSLRIPSAVWLYFKIAPNEIPTLKLNINNVVFVKQIREMEEAFSKIVPPTPEELEAVDKMADKEKMDWLLKTLKPLIDLQSSFHSWAKSLTEVKKDLQLLSMKIEAEFNKYKV